jgi:hypothetical protein
MMDTPLPPAVRRVQQSWYWQALGLPLSLGFGSAILVQGCLANGIDHISRACVMSALSGALISFLTVLVSGHPPGSSDFHSDGTPNKTVQDVVVAQKGSEAGIPGAADAVKRIAAVVDTNAREVKIAAAITEAPESGTSCPR